jgi:uncharacterized protein VirK/YbjX
MTTAIDYATTGEENRNSARGVLLGPLSILMRQKKTWSPVLLAGVLGRAVSNIGRHRKIVEILKLPEYAQLAHADPRFAFKYFTHGYLARQLSVAERASCFVHHYRTLQERLPRVFLRQILHRDVALVEIREGESCFAVTFGLSRTHDKEGELSLNLLVDGQTVFILSFTIVPGKAVKSQAEEVLLITRIQGMKGCYRQISRATKALHNVAPAALLIAALQGVGEALGIGVLGCISATDQNSYCEECAAAFKTAYDDFFTERGVEKNQANFFLAPIPLKEKPMSQVKPGHKLRTREKRVFKREIASAVCRLLEQSCRGNSRLLYPIRMSPVPVQEAAYAALAK